MNNSTNTRRNQAWNIWVTKSALQKVSRFSLLGALSTLFFLHAYANQVKRCAEMTRKLRFFRDQINKSGLSPTGPPHEPATDFDELEFFFCACRSNLVNMKLNSKK